MGHRTLLCLGFAAIAGCASHDGLDGTGSFRGTIGDIDFQIVPVAPSSDGAKMRIEPDGTATRFTPETGLRTAILDRGTLDDLHARIAAARFPTLAPHYGCIGICVLIASPLYHAAVQLDDRPYEVDVESYFLTHQADLFPAELVAALTSLRDIFDHAQWR